jgi:hypothetical protein
MVFYKTDVASSLGLKKLAHFLQSEYLIQGGPTLFSPENGVVSEVVFNSTVQSSLSNHFILTFVLNQNYEDGSFLGI